MSSFSEQEDLFHSELSLSVRPDSLKKMPNPLYKIWPFKIVAQPYKTYPTIAQF